MKYYSDELKKFFDSEEACVKAEAEHKNMKEKADKRKSELRALIDQAEADLKEAREKDQVVKKEVERILDESNKKMEEMIKASEAVIAEKKKLYNEAVSNYNKEFGLYYKTETKSTTDPKEAVSLFDKWLDWIDMF